MIISQAGSEIENPRSENNTNFTWKAQEKAATRLHLPLDLSFVVSSLVYSPNERATQPVKHCARLNTHPGTRSRSRSSILRTGVPSTDVSAQTDNRVEARASDDPRRPNRRSHAVDVRVATLRARATAADRPPAARRRRCAGDDGRAPGAPGSRLEGQGAGGSSKRLRARPKLLTCIGIRPA
eukprot:COSAG02_NODE_3143_length_7292_cov_20.803698_2_plen_182_part_00